ncbi:MAG: trypsin-like peptidase domain-containing protein, partial [Candidatus Eisenbacteria sp.]|nr:trypsin-like peptidase domain-containing protein [Candidatus Eisenbacteria bacterium]
MRVSGLTLYDSVHVSNEIFVFGYPRSLGLKQIPQMDYDAPLLNKGVLSGKNNSRKILIVAAAVYPGNSGGPVVEINREGNVAQFG